MNGVGEADENVDAEAKAEQPAEPVLTMACLFVGPYGQSGEEDRAQRAVPLAVGETCPSARQ